MDTARFEDLVARAADELPEGIREYIDNVDIVVEDFPTAEQLAKSGTRKGFTLLGLYEGIPHTERGNHYGMVIPDKISIFRKNIEAMCHGDDEIVREIGKVVRHEIAHHFGISDARLKELEQD
jgi:predicted Zn-dependent protease with MMP-like domain